MRVLLTGAGGFLGRPLAAALRARGAAVRGVVRDRCSAPPCVEPFEADLASDPVEAALAGVDVVVHLAASLRGPASHLERNNIEATRRLLEAMAMSRVRRLVLASSLSVYDWAAVRGSLSESATTLQGGTLARCDDYARTKALQEALARCLAHEHGWTLTVLRCAAVWGGQVWAEFMLGKRWRALQTVVAPRAPARLVYLHNAVDAFATAAQRERGGELVLNLVDEPPLSNWQYARVVQRHRGGMLIPVPYAAGWLAARCAMRTGRFQSLHKPAACASSALRTRLRWTPPFTLQQALEHVGQEAGQQANSWS